MEPSMTETHRAVRRLRNAGTTHVRAYGRERSKGVDTLDDQCECGACVSAFRVIDHNKSHRHSPHAEGGERKSHL